MKKQIHIFFTALMFFTRIPCPKWVNHAPEYLNKSTSYFSLVGIIVGSISAFVYLISGLLFSNEIALLLSMVASVWTTGAFHEDGFADACDGFGGGWTKEKILLIMKDSRLGTYGVVGLFFLLATKFLALNEMPLELTALVIVSGHSVSRFVASVLIFTHPYVRETDDSKSKPAANKMSLNALVMSAFFGLLPLVFFQDYKFFLVLIPLAITKIWMAGFYKKWIGGQTGDCAGALQQLSEVVFYLSLVVLWKYI
ncbi:adenosylcobinamide-GDP ribazoletransferase [Flavicella sediminum]|uniref:adenosylcobinamide-GDP ribazoletransferase n=1 Tax=Flavicella sediminum TaxID=2585141 RepID=UPI0011213A67|nr:adenosylcobinamide-GDP ribazoletransferase [Flavicella sediminum]